MKELEEYPVITRELINEIRDRLQHIYLDTRRLVPNTQDYDLLMECIREAITPYLPFTMDMLDKVVDDAYGLYLNFQAVEKIK
ncbi:MAG: hypothetical protein JRJ12_14225 [Deltaproteobacteria bacterium]|nr:hypothetical protein [Deltaproteobacteria bacterium]MBW2071657.1 hypothetical protein [Deltaproteobacteria bacterium]